MKPKEYFKKEFNTFKDHHQTDGYELVLVQNIYLPYWDCKQDVVIEKDVEADKFSKILLNLLQQNVNTHTEICDFLGIDEDSFVLMQLHFLISNNLIIETFEAGQTKYEITQDGIEFLENRGSIQKSETIQYEYLFNDIEKTFVVENKSPPYKILTTKRLKNNHQLANHIPHSNKPTLNSFKITEFSELFNKTNNTGSFYDYGTNKIIAHKRSIKFLMLYYLNKEDQCKVEIRQSKDSVNRFTGHEIEQSLSIAVKNYIDENHEFINGLKI